MLNLLQVDKVSFHTFTAFIYQMLLFKHLKRCLGIIINCSLNYLKLVKNGCEGVQNTMIVAIG